MTRSISGVLVSLLAFAMLSGCTTVVLESPEEIRIDTGFAGEIAPGTQSWWGHLGAGDHCDRFGKDARLVDTRGTVSIYRCLERKRD